MTPQRRQNTHRPGEVVPSTCNAQSLGPERLEKAADAYRTTRRRRYSFLSPTEKGRAS